MSNSAKYEEYLNAAKLKKNGDSAAWDNLMTSYKNQAAENMAKGPSLTREEIAAPSYTQPTQPQPTTPSYYEYMAQNAVNQRNVTYAEAERARKEAEALAEIERKRSIVDASTMAEQQKATYGANAEQMGRMGLSGSGYSDYLNSQAYAAGMAGRQAANAHATDLNRQALYTEHMTRLGADKEYNNALAQIETAKYNEQKALEERNYAEQKQKEAANQTTYYSILDGIANGTINKDNIDMYLNNSDLSDTSKNSLATYAGNKVNTSGLETSLAAYEASKDFVNAAISYVDLNYPDATDEQKKTFQANYIVNHLSEIDDSKLAEYAKKISNGDYGTAGGEAIKKAVSQTYVDSADTLNKEELKTVIDSGILTTEAQSKLDTVYANKYGETKQEQVSIATENASEIFGKFAGSNNPKSEQSIYVDKLIGMAKGEIKTSKGEALQPGDVVKVNYGYGNSKNSFFKYLGNGKFEKAEFVKGGWITVVVPEGYEAQEHISNGEKSIFIKKK